KKEIKEIKVTKVKPEPKVVKEIKETKVTKVKPEPKVKKEIKEIKVTKVKPEPKVVKEIKETKAIRATPVTIMCQIPMERSTNTTRTATRLLQQYHGLAWA
ncbi:hypothetical protein, partial [Xylanibacter muris]|uniref:hypothetical protein n=1 Tax=Xylanibacter muris TaxID=2736290 RepID=UPI002557CDC5